ncbi:hypothetical protein EOD42_22125 [Rhodovarius crocodyli]|uniref:Uncharacterized protein n=1 Tax=Rhodovarius crocodyli TaxID=1979269 RepID=A0A437M234_9PROT|nr:PLP-dependent transferase [Rhodovarius crocodyli]RVT91672.1 hypothetical protein EOD42_22125 [Rhodovarius crocodyli]
MLQRSRFCFLCITRDAVRGGDPRGLLGVLTALAVGTLGYAVVFGSWLPVPMRPGLPPDAHIGPVSWVLVLAGVAFGLGMTLSGSCVSGHLYRLGEGSVRAPIALMGTAVGFLLGFISWPFLYEAGIRGAPVVWLPHWLGYAGTILVSLAVLGLLALPLLRRLPAGAAASGPLGLRDVLRRLFRHRWPGWLGGMGVGSIGAVAYLRTEPLGVTAAIGGVARAAGDALALGSGQAASAFSVLAIAQAGDNIVSSTDLYGGTWNLFANTLRRQGIEVRFVDPADPEAFARATDTRTRAYYGETLPNPKLAVFPIAEVAAIGCSFGVPLILDNTAAPFLARPLEHGAAIVVYSLTKYLGGHGTSIGGAIIDGGNFDWTAHPDRHPLLTQPDPSYHGVIWTEAAPKLGVAPYVAAARSSVQRDLGASLSPFNAFQILQGIETLPLRIQKHSVNAEAVARWLALQPEVLRVIHPSQQSGEVRVRADRYLSGGYGGLVGAELRGGARDGARLIDALKLFYHVANIGDARSLAIHPASTTHGQLSQDEQAATGVSAGYVRFSIGLEHIDDIIEDLEQAFATLALPLAAE